jgi:cytochrome c oxidase subunit II
MTLYSHAVLLCLLSTGAASAQEHPLQDIFKPVATPAQSTFDLSLLVFAICGAVFVIVAGLLTYAIIRFRARPWTDSSEPAQLYGSNQVEIAWTVIPILIVFVLTMATARVTSALQNKRPPANALNVTVVGHQWWWEYRYPDLKIATANELHVPVSSPSQSRPTFLRLESADVNHSFWVPQVSGKTDVIPNRGNHMWIDPVEIGTFYGNCAEYCGTQHANMLIRVVVDTPEDFEKWVAAQREVNATAGPAADRNSFMSLSCINCHTVSGTPAAGRFGPNLTHLMSRHTLASGQITNTPEHLREWLRSPQSIKPGCFMPDMQLNDQELNSVVAYLSSLH